MGFGVTAVSGDDPKPQTTAPYDRPTGKNADADAAYQKYVSALDPSKIAEAKNNVTNAINQVLAADAEKITTEANRITSSNVRAFLGESYLGSDQWVSDHTNPGQWKLSVFKNGYAYAQMMAIYATGDKERAAYRGEAQFYATQRMMEQSMQDAVAATNAVKEGKAL